MKWAQPWLLSTFFSASWTYGTVAHWGILPENRWCDCEILTFFQDVHGVRQEFWQCNPHHQHNLRQKCQIRCNYGRYSRKEFKVVESLKHDFNRFLYCRPCLNVGIYRYNITCWRRSKGFPDMKSYSRSIWKSYQRIHLTKPIQKVSFGQSYEMSVINITISFCGAIFRWRSDTGFMHNFAIPLSIGKYSSWL